MLSVVAVMVMRAFGQRHAGERRVAARVDRDRASAEHGASLPMVYVNVTLPLVIGWPSPVTWTVSVPCQPVVPVSLSWRQPARRRSDRAQDLARRRRGERDDRRGADDHAARNRRQRRSVAGRVGLGRGDVVLAEVEVDRRERRDAAGEGRVRVRVGRRAVGHLQDDAAGLGVERHGLRERRRTTAWKLPQRFAGVAASARAARCRPRRRRGCSVPMLTRVDRVGDAHAQLGRRRDGAVRVLDAVRQRHAREARDEAEARRAVVGGDGGHGRDRRAERRRASRR